MITLHDALVVQKNLHAANTTWRAVRYVTMSLAVETHFASTSSIMPRPKCSSAKSDGHLWKSRGAQKNEKDSVSTLIEALEEDEDVTCVSTVDFIHGLSFPIPIARTGGICDREFSGAKPYFAGLQPLLGNA